MKVVGVLVSLAAAVSADVVSLTPENFDEYVNGDSHVLVKFYAPWCGHCKAMAEDYITASNAFTKYPEVVFAEADVDAHKTLGSRFGVTGFPTLKWFEKGSTEATDYSAGRGVDDLVTYVNGKAKTKAFVSKPLSDVVDLTPRNFDSYMKKDVGMMLEFFAPWCGHCKKLAPIYEEVGTTYSNEDTVVIAKVDADAHKTLGTPYGVTGFPTLKWIPADCHGSDCAEDYKGAREGDDLVKFINDKMATKRVLGGRLDDTVGRDDNLDEVVPTFMAASQTEKEAVIQKAESLASDDVDAIFYVKVMKKMVKLADKGEAWLADEVNRLSGMLDKPVEARKKDDFNKRLNVIRRFHDEL